MAAVLVLAVVLTSGGAMAGVDPVINEASRLLTTLSGMEVSKLALSRGFSEYSDASKNALVAGLARSSTWPPDRVLARLPYIATPDNRDDMIAIYKRNLASPDHGGRRESVFGLERLGDPSAVDAARQALNDDADDVVVAAVSVLLPYAKRDESVWHLLQDTYRQRRNDVRLYNSMGLLKDSGIERPTPPR
ncbi:MAG TPA: hypothetical protein VGL09_21380 [Methylomirabilota bacterium]|jgi:hypothetical protein